MLRRGAMHGKNYLIGLKHRVRIISNAIEHERWHRHEIVRNALRVLFDCSDLRNLRQTSAKVPSYSRSASRNQPQLHFCKHKK